jgi:hypothetical protein
MKSDFDLSAPMANYDFSHQAVLAASLETGIVIPGSGGLRKMHCSHGV